MDKPKISTLTLTYNRLPLLKNCIESIRKNTGSTHEIIVVNNASIDGTKEWLNSQPDIISVHMDKNIGVIARNKGLEIAKGELIAQIDDDVVVLPKWDAIMLLEFAFDPNVVATGVQGALFSDWKHIFKPGNRGGYVDFITGFMFMFKNLPEFRYDEDFGAFWHEESSLCLLMKSMGYRLRQCPMVCSHNCARGDKVDWDLHNKNFDLLKSKWQSKEKLLNFEG